MPPPNEQQAERWNRQSGPIWVEMQALVDRVLAPFEAHLTAIAFPGEGRRVLDIGCGAGATTLAMARRLGPKGLALGVDISQPLVEAARARAAALGLRTARFACGDAQIYAFDPGAFDAVISRFGVMFFDDPVAAFSNIRRAAAPGGRLAFLAFRTPEENPFMTAAARALAPLLPDLTTPAPEAPGQFAFADAGRVRDILGRAGWREVEIERLDVDCEVPGEDLVSYGMNMGPAGPALREGAPATREAARTLLQSAFQPFLEGNVARFQAACWQVAALA